MWRPNGSIMPPSYQAAGRFIQRLKVAKLCGLQSRCGVRFGEGVKDAFHFSALVAREDRPYATRLLGQIVNRWEDAAIYADGPAGQSDAARTAVVEYLAKCCWLQAEQAREGKFEQVGLALIKDTQQEARFQLSCRGELFDQLARAVGGACLSGIGGFRLDGQARLSKHRLNFFGRFRETPDHMVLERFGNPTAQSRRQNRRKIAAMRKRIVEAFNSLGFFHQCFKSGGADARRCIAYEGNQHRFCIAAHQKLRDRLANIWPLGNSGLMRNGRLRDKAQNFGICQFSASQDDWTRDFDFIVAKPVSY